MQIAPPDISQQSLSASARQYYSWELIDHLLNEIREYAIFMVDPLGILVTWNPGVQRLLGYSEKEFIGQPFSLIFTEEDRKQDVARHELESANATGRAEDQRWHQRRDGSRFWANGLVTASRNDQGKITGFVKIMRDQTAQKQLETQIGEYAGRLARTNEQLLHFAGIVSHDLNAPLQSVRGFAAIVEEKTRDADSEVQDSIHHILDSADHMLLLVKELLTFSRDSAGAITIETVDSEQCFRSTLQNLSAAIERVQALVTHDPLPPVKASLIQLNRVFQNLLENSLKYIRPGVTPQIHVSSRRQGDAIIFSVSDNGLGMDLTETQHIFTMFDRASTDASVPGTGIGLAATRRIVELMGGELSVESTKGIGSTFSFSLPNPTAS